MRRELSKDEKIQLGAKVFCGVLSVSLIAGSFIYMKYEHDKAQEQVLYEIENGLNGAKYDEVSEEFEEFVKEPLSNEDDIYIEKNIEDSFIKVENIEEITKEYVEEPITDEINEKVEKEQFVEKNTEIQQNEIEKQTILIDNTKNEEPIKLPDTESTGFDKNGHPYLIKGHDYTFGADGYPIEAPPSGQKTATIVNPITGIKYTYIGKMGNNEYYHWNENHQAEIMERARLITSGYMQADGTILTDENRGHNVENRIKLAP